MIGKDAASGGGVAPDRRIRIVLADDHQVVRRGLELVLSGTPEFEVVAQVGDVSSVGIAVREHQPDVLVLDLHMLGQSSLEAIPTLRGTYPQTQIVVLTMEASPSLVRAARRAGALGYVLKEAVDSELSEAVRRAAVGRSYLNPRLAEQLLSAEIRERDWS
ncbi:MAG TPA: response regulator transcription factor [Solirubrobacteraceae bacterium]|nr:response regulator transcription factor [Solirubrobacteraceae bacterium]